MEDINKTLTIHYTFEDKCYLCEGIRIFTEETYKKHLHFVKVTQQRFDDEEGDKYDDFIHTHSSEVVKELTKCLESSQFPITCPECKGKGKTLTLTGKSAIEWVKNTKGEYDDV